MTCPIESLDSFLAEHWDVDSLCSMMGCPKCTAEPGEGVLWRMLYPPFVHEPEPEADIGDYDTPF